VQHKSCVATIYRNINRGVHRYEVRYHNADGVRQRASFPYHESLMSDWERRGQQDLFRLRRSVGVKQRITLLEGQGGWAARRSRLEGNWRGSSS